MPLVSATRGDDLWRWQVGNRGHPFGGIGSIRTRTAHGCVLLARIVGPALYDECPTGAIPKPGKEAIVSITVDFQDETTDFCLLDDSKAFFECVLAFLIAFGSNSSM